MSIAFDLHRASQAYAEIYTQEARWFALAKKRRVLTLRQLQLANCIERVPFTQAAIVNLTGIDRSTLSDMLRNLEREKIVERMRGGDTRQKIVRLTHIGESLLVDAREVMRRAERAFVRRLRRRDELILLKRLLVQLTKEKAVA